MPEEDALALVERYQPGGEFPDEAARETSREIVRLLGCFPLAVEAAAVFLGQFAEYVTCAGFKQRLVNEGLRELEQAVSDPSVKVRHDEIRLTATLKVTLERLGEAERMTLRFAALMPADHVALPWLRALVGKAIPESITDVRPGYLDPWQTLLCRLYSLRLLQPTAEETDVRIHRLLQEVLKLDAGVDAVQLLERALRAHVKIRAGFLGDDWIQHDHRWELVPIAACVQQWIEGGADEDAYLANQVIGPLLHLRQVRGGRTALPAGAEIYEKSFGPIHPNLATGLNNLAALLNATNRHAEAEPLHRRALAIYEQSFGPVHPKVATSLNNLAALLNATNRSVEAEELYRRSTDHP